jgi:hypothetical protein
LMSGTWAWKRYVFLSIFIFVLMPW